MARTLMIMLLFLVPLAAGAQPAGQAPDGPSLVEVFDEVLEELVAATPGVSRRVLCRDLANQAGLDPALMRCSHPLRARERSP